MPIDVIIPEQNFEKIRDRVALILGNELADQFILNPDPLFQAGIWLERFIPFDKGELPVIKVYYNNSTYDQNTPASSKGECKIIIEVTVNSKDSSTEDGDIAASKACQKLAGVIRFILMHPLYLKLDFPAGFIAGTEITDIAPGVPQPGDAFNTYALNLILNVRYSEDNGSISPVVGEHYTTIVKLDETDKGIKIEKIV